MISHKLVEQISQFLDIFAPSGKLSYLDRNLEILTRVNDSVLEAIAKATSNETIGRIASLITSQDSFKEAQARFKEVRPSVFLQQLAILNETIQTYFPDKEFSRIYISQNSYYSERELTELINVAIKKYEDYLQSHAIGDFLHFCSVSAHVYYLLRDYRALLTIVQRRLTLQLKTHETDEAEFSMLLESDLSLGGFALKLNALEQIYLELANLLHLSIDPNSIKVVKIESGSFWTDIVGNKKVTPLLEGLIADTVSYFYRNFTREGKISSLPRRVDAIEDILHLREKLSALGIPTAELDETLQKSSVVIAKQLNQLLVGEATVTINDKTYSVSAELKQKYIEGSKTLLLTEPPSANQSSSVSDKTD